MVLAEFDEGVMSMASLPSVRHIRIADSQATSSPPPPIKSRGREVVALAVFRTGAIPACSIHMTKPASTTVNQRTGLFSIRLASARARCATTVLDGGGVGKNAGRASERVTRLRFPERLHRR